MEQMSFPNKRYSVIYADPPWAYRQCGKTEKSRGTAAKHYNTMTTDDICNLPVPSICTPDAACFMWATFPNIGEAIQVMESWGFKYVTAAFVWVKKYAKSGKNFWGMGAYTRANAEVCLLGIAPGFKAGEKVISHKVHQIIEAPYEGHSKKPDIVRDKIVELLGDIPRIELFARQRAEGWDSWGDEVPDAEHVFVGPEHIVIDFFRENDVDYIDISLIEEIASKLKQYLVRCDRCASAVIDVNEDSIIRMVHIYSKFFEMVDTKIYKVGDLSTLSNIQLPTWIDLFEIRLSVL